ncbi:MAG: hypothetical protein WDM87_10720 [Terracidiphilus sp.]
MCRSNGSIDGGMRQWVFILMAATTSPACATTATRRRTPTRWRSFRVETSAFGAQYGQFSAAVVSVITKSGTNHLHGGVFEFNRNTDFNANSWAPAHNAAGQIIVTPYHRNQFGGDVGRADQEGQGLLLLQLWRFAPDKQMRCLQAPSRPRLTSAWATLPGDTFVVYTPGTTHIAANQVDGNQQQPELRGCETELHTAGLAGHDHFQHG